MTTATLPATLDQALSERFNDLSEMMDIAKYGCAAGVSGFIYSTELHEFFDTYTDEIWDKLEELDVHMSDLVGDIDRWTSQEVAEKACWIVVENYCSHMVTS